ncbi:hypothetical protein FA15DRAFT_668122 [Coprinopsis marcescibilis]|uniref:Uncharacterized protein n=1 Tax=Coprinopsis marcescibilis TaxID=230819 RepID=A0A5C3KZS9_COPMA|nr:hypothetical protein FA15DRAFT_668122 [Coprinopsis marcescibilis]
MSGLGLITWAASGLQLLSSKLVHPVYFPYPWAPVLHAARISLVFQSLGRKNDANWKQLLWGPYIFGYLAACWGGGVITHLLLGLPPPHFYSFHPFINYITVHLVLTAVINRYPQILVPKIFDTVLFPLDGLLRAHAVVSAISLLASPSISTPLSGLSQPSPFKAMDTPFGHMLLGALASAFGGIALNTLSLWSNDWKFTTPPILKASIWGSADVWGGALAAVVYSSSVHANAFAVPTVLSAAYFPLTLLPSWVLNIFFKPGFSSINFAEGTKPYMHFTFPIIYTLLGLKNTDIVAVPEDPTAEVNLEEIRAPLMQVVGIDIGTIQAKALAAVVLATIFGLRVLVTHWLVEPPRVGSKPKSQDSGSSTSVGKGDTQSRVSKR